MKTRVIFWDIDGTLLDFTAAEHAAIRRTYSEFGLGECTDQMLADYAEINRVHWEMLERGECTKHETLTHRFVDFFSLYHIDADPEAFNDIYQLRLPDTIVFRPHAWETVCALQKHYTQYCITNGYLPVQKRKLTESGLASVFRDSFISDEIGFEKPSRAFFDLVLSRVKCAPEESLVIGDSLTSDILGANNANIPCCWYNPEGRPITGDVHVDFQIRDLKELLNLLLPDNTI